MHTKLPIISSYKIHLFVCLIFEEFEGVSKSGILWPVAWAGIIKKFIRFFKIVPLGVSSFFFQLVPKWKEVSIGLDSLLTIVTNSFENSIIKNLETFFHHFFALTLWSWNLFPFLEISTKFLMTKGIQNKFIHFVQMLVSKQSLHFFKNAFTNENIHKQKTAPSWFVILMLLMTINKFS